MSMDSPRTIFGLLGFAAGFMLGRYIIENIAITRLVSLIKRDPIVFYHRHKLYPLFSNYQNDHEASLWKRPKHFLDRLQETITSSLSAKLDDLFEAKEQRLENNNILDIVKYGLLSTENLSVHTDHIVASDTHTGVAQWVCQHLRSDSILAIDHSELLLLADAPKRFCQALKSELWSNLEQYALELAKQYGSVYAYTGPVYWPKDNCVEYWIDYVVKDWIPMAVPSHFFKVLIIESDLPGCSPFVEAYLVPNEELTRSADLQIFLSSLYEIARCTGYQFPNNLRTKIVPHSEVKLQTVQMQQSFSQTNF